MIEFIEHYSAEHNAAQALIEIANQLERQNDLLERIEKNGLGLKR